MRWGIVVCCAVGVRLCVCVCGWSEVGGAWVIVSDVIFGGVHDVGVRGEVRDLVFIVVLFKCVLWERLGFVKAVEMKAVEMRCKAWFFQVINW